MNWATWKYVLGQKAEDLSVGRLVYFRRGNGPELGRIAGTGNDIRVPLLRCDETGRVSMRRTYWRNRSQLYVKR